MSYAIQLRKEILVNTDVQRRCYNDCHYKSELQWGEWDTIQQDIPAEKIEECLKSWRELHVYSRSIGNTQKCEFRAIKVA